MGGLSSAQGKGGTEEVRLSWEPEGSLLKLGAEAKSLLLCSTHWAVAGG